MSSWSPSWPPRPSPSFDSMWADLATVGRAPATGGYRRFTWTAAELECRAWFRQEGARRGLDVQDDRNGNLWAWDGPGRPGRAVVTGSHLDSVPDGGAFDGPLGIVSAFAALDELRAGGWEPVRPVAVVAFAEEEGARFGVACAGSRLLAGVLDPARACGLRDVDGVTLAEAMYAAGGDPSRLGRDDALLRRIGCYVELHVEQGRGLAAGPEDAPPAAVGVGTGIWPHGRWRLDFRGAADHAGTTELSDRRDPMLAFAETVLLAREQAERAGARATIGRVRVAPNGTNAIASEVVAWLDARAPSETTVRTLVETVVDGARRRAARDGVTVDSTEESFSPDVAFDPGLIDRVARLGAGLAGEAPLLATGAGHDAGILSAAGIPTVMLFVRNPTGVSHSPAEHAERADCLAGVAALADVLGRLAGDEALPP